MAVTLRPFAIEDVPEITRLLSAGPEISVRTARIPFPYTEEDARKFLIHVLEQGERAYALTVDGDLVGAIGMMGDGAEVEIGYWVGKEYWHRGYATEAVSRLIDLARERGVTRMFAHVFPDNGASARVLEKNGFLFEGEIEKDVPQRGGLRRLLQYALAL
jgi:RimJ/RimL family protein N-acetyltransferase